MRNKSSLTNKSANLESLKRNAIAQSCCVRDSVATNSIRVIEMAKTIIVKFRAQTELRGALNRGAEINNVTLSEFVRQAIIEKLATVGIDATPRLYALVCNGEIVNCAEGKPVITGYVSCKPETYSDNYPAGCKWLPIESADAEQFDTKTQWRLPSIYFVNGDHVVRMYPVIQKSWEHILSRRDSTKSKTKRKLF